MQCLANGIIAGSLAALIAGGLALVYGMMGVFNLALGQMVLFGGYSAWWLREAAGLPLFPSILGGLLAGALLSWLTFQVFVLPFFRAHPFLPLVTTIAWGMILDGLMLLLFEERPRSILPGAKHLFPIGQATASIEQVVLVLATLLLLCSLAYVLHAAPFGRKVRAVLQHSHAAQSVGISAVFLERAVFVASGVLAAGAGIFLGIDQNLSPTLAFPLTIKAYAAIIAGGRGNVWGAILCAYLIALLEQFVVGIRWFGLFYVSPGYQATVALLAIIFFLLLKPEGLFAQRARTA